MTSPNRVADLLTEKLKELERVQVDVERAKRNVELIQAQIEVLRQVLPDAIPPRPEFASAYLVSLPPADRPKKRGRKGIWRDVLAATGARFSNQFSFDDIQNVAREMGVELPRSTVRSQSANYVDYGFMERVTQGNFRLTDLGRKEFKIGSDDREITVTRVLGSDATPSAQVIHSSSEGEEN